MAIVSVPPQEDFHLSAWEGRDDGCATAGIGSGAGIFRPFGQGDSGERRGGEKGEKA